MRVSPVSLTAVLPFLDSYAMLMNQTRGETTIYDCLCPGSLTVRMQDINHMIPG